MNRGMRLVGGFFLALGLAGLSMGLGMLAGMEFNATGTACKAACGLVALTEALFGQASGRFLGGLLWLLIGGTFAYIGQRVLRG